MQTRRQITPAVYSLDRSEGRNTEETKLISPSELEAALKLKVDVKVEKLSEKFLGEIAELRARNVRTGGNDLNKSDIQEIQEIVDDSDSEIECQVLVEPEIKQGDVSASDTTGSLTPFLSETQRSIGDDTSGLVNEEAVHQSILVETQRSIGANPTGCVDEKVVPNQQSISTEIQCSIGADTTEKSDPNQQSIQTETNHLTNADTIANNEASSNSTKSDNGSSMNQINRSPTELEGDSNQKYGNLGLKLVMPANDAVSGDLFFYENVSGKVLLFAKKV